MVSAGHSVMSQRLSKQLWRMAVPDSVCRLSVFVVPLEYSIRILSATTRLDLRY